MKLRTLSLSILLFSLLSSLSVANEKTAKSKKTLLKNTTKKIKYLETGAQRKLDITYKKVGKRELKFDLYYPTTKSNDSVPLIIYTHGGGWAAGSRHGVTKSLFAPLFIKLLAKGFAVATVDYRLYNKSGKIAMRDCVIDSKDAVRYLHQHAQELKVDSERFYVMGDSAGGQIAQMLLLSPSGSLVGDPELAQVSYKILAGVSWYGPCDFEDQNLFNYDDRSDFKDRFGPRISPSIVSDEEKLRLYREMSPINYLKTNSPPLLMIQGDRDTTIPVKHAYHMQKRATELNANVEVLIINNSGHNWKKVKKDIQPSFTEIVQRTVDFYVEQNSK